VPGQAQIRLCGHWNARERAFHVDWYRGYHELTYPKTKLAESCMKNVGRLAIETKRDVATNGSQVQLEEIAAPKTPAVLKNISKRFEKPWKRPRFLKGCRYGEKEVFSRLNTSPTTRCRGDPNV
jgi:hypothetical protein